MLCDTRPGGQTLSLDFKDITTLGQGRKLAEYLQRYLKPHYLIRLIVDEEYSNQSKTA